MLGHTLPRHGPGNTRDETLSIRIAGLRPLVEVTVSSSILLKPRLSIVKNCWENKKTSRRVKRSLRHHRIDSFFEFGAGLRQYL